MLHLLMTICPAGDALSQPHSADEKTEAQKGDITGSRSHSQYVAELGSDLRSD